MTAPIVIKLGGRALEREETIPELGSELRSLGAPVILIHGGGGEVSEWCRRLGIEPRFAGGRRITDAATLDVVVAVLCGLANKRLVARLRSQGLDAFGAAVAEEDLVVSGGARQLGGELEAGAMAEEIRDVAERSHLARDRARESRRNVTERVDRDPADEVEVFLALGILDSRAASRD